MLKASGNRARRSTSRVSALRRSRRSCAGLKIKVAIDKRSYDTALKVSDETFAAVKLKPSRFHGEWNYAIG